MTRTSSDVAVRPGADLWPRPADMYKSLRVLQKILVLDFVAVAGNYRLAASQGMHRNLRPLEIPAQTMLMCDNREAANISAAGGETVARNLITDVAGLRVGHADDHRLASGSTVIVFDEPAVAGVDVRGGGPGSRDTELLDPAMTVECIDAVTLSGGSAFGLDAASGVQAWLREQGRGFAVAGMVVPIVPGAVLFDLGNGGDKNWGRFAPYRDLGYAATAAASTDFGLGSVGAGLGATTVNLKGGIGSASATARDGHTVGAVVAVNAVGSVTVGAGPSFWAAAFEVHHEFGGRGWPSPMPADALALRTKGGPLASTTIALVATDATLTKAQAKRLAVMAQDGFARAIYPVHTPLDGDTVSVGRSLIRFTNSPSWELSRPTCSPGPSLAASMRRPLCPCPARCRAGATGSADNNSLGGIGRVEDSNAYCRLQRWKQTCIPATFAPAPRCCAVRPSRPLSSARSLRSLRRTIACSRRRWSSPAR